MSNTDPAGDQLDLLSRVAAVIGDSATRAVDQLPNAPTPLQLRVLAAVAAAPSPPNLTQIAAAVGTSTPTLSRLVDRLTAAGLLDRRPSPDSGREVTLTVTRRGQRILADCDRRRAAELQRLLDALDPARRATALAGFTALLGGHAAPPVAGPDLTVLRSNLVRDLRAADPVDAVDVLVRFVRDHTAAAAVCLRLVSHDGTTLHAIAVARSDDMPPAASSTATEGDDGPFGFPPVGVEDGPPGAALLTGRLQVEDDGRWTAVHAPVTANPEALGALTVITAAGLSAEHRAAVEAITDALAPVAGVVLPTTARGAQALDGARRRREWTVTAEMQWAQLPGRTLRSQGFDLAGQIEPAWDVCSDAYDWSARDGAVAAAVLTAGTTAPGAPFVTALALGALRHARRLGRTLPEQASLIDQALYAQFAGRLTCDGALVELTRDPLGVAVLATAGIRVFRARRGRVTQITLPEQPPWGGTGDSDYTATAVPAAAGDRFVVLGHGFTDRPRSKLTTVIRGLSADPPGPVVRHLIGHLLTTSDAADQDATALCIDLTDPAAGAPAG